MGHNAPPWLGKTGDVTETQRYAKMTPAERLGCWVDVMELAHAILVARPDARQVLARTEPMPKHAEQTWLRLVREARGARAAG
jgi:hypothetical protein